MDTRVYHALNDFAWRHHWLGTLFQWIEKVSIPVLVVAIVGLWLFARPGGSRRWKHAATYGLASAAVALLANQVLSHIWNRTRPFVHHRAHVFGTHAADSSFPSDHASASFAIAAAVLAFSPLVGGLFLAAAVLISLGRLFIGVHYPTDVLAGVLVGVASALAVRMLLRPLLDRLVRLVERATDPLLGVAWRRLG